MENIYEFKNTKLEKASVELKAIAYDVLTSLDNDQDRNNWVNLINQVTNTLENIDSNKKIEIKETTKNEVNKTEEKEVITEEEATENSQIEDHQEVTKQEEAELPQQPKQFIKTSKKESKAIMVRPNQLQNLKNSKEEQENILADLGVFPKSSKKEIKVVKQEVTPQIPDDVERKIEDLTVKANIYYNEGETEKAQELYDEIKELNKKYKSA